MVPRFLLLLPFIQAVSAVYFNNAGTMIQNSYKSSSNIQGAQFTTISFSESTQSAPYNGTFLLFGFIGSGTCSGSLIKSWSGSTPSSDLYAVGVTSARCLNSFNSDIAEGKIVRDYVLPIANSDLNTRDAVFKRYYQYQDFPNKVFTTTIRKISFAVANVNDLAVIELSAKAIDLYRSKYTFYEIADDEAAVNTNIINIGFQDVQFLWYNMRSMTGRIVGVEDYYDPEFGQSIHNATKHNSNIFSTGAPIFSTSNATKIYAIATEEGPTWNYAQNLQGLKSCFTDVGEFSLNRPNCMIDFKLAYTNVTNSVVDGMRYIAKANQNQGSTPDNSNYAGEIMQTYNLTSAGEEYEDYNIAWSSSSSNTGRMLVFIPLICLTLWNII